MGKAGGRDGLLLAADECTPIDDYYEENDEEGD